MFHFEISNVQREFLKIKFAFKAKGFEISTLRQTALASRVFLYLNNSYNIQEKILISAFPTILLLCELVIF
jgi:hypothetical protein